MLVLKGVSLLYAPIQALSLPPPQLLDRDTSRRFGCKPDGEGYQELRRHPWFKSIDWDTLETKEQIPPFVPDVSTTPSMHILC